MKCSNCEAQIKGITGLIVGFGPELKTVARICDTCTENVLTLKVVLKREDPKQDFVFDGYLPVQSVK